MLSWTTLVFVTITMVASVGAVYFLHVVALFYQSEGLVNGVFVQSG